MASSFTVGKWTIQVTKLGCETYACTCKDFEYRNDRFGNCKNCFALDCYLRLQVKVIDEQLVEQANPKKILLYLLITSLLQSFTAVNVVSEY